MKPHSHRYCVAALALACGLAWAQAEHDSVRRDVQSGKLKPLAEILSGVQRRHAGRIIDIELERGADGRRWYEIKILNGQRTELYVDAVTGQEIPKPDAASPHLLPMGTVVRQVLAPHPGVVLKVELEDDPGALPYYELQLLGKDGRELLLRADAQTGRLIGEPPIQPALASRLLPVHRVVEALETRYKARATEAELKTTRSRWAASSATTPPCSTSACRSRTASPCCGTGASRARPSRCWC